MDDKGLLAKRRNKAIVRIMDFKEKQCDVYLPEDISFNLRKVILDELNGFADLVFDILDDDISFNEEYYNMLDDIHKVLVGGKDGKTNTS